MTTKLYIITRTTIDRMVYDDDGLMHCVFSDLATNTAYATIEKAVFARQMLVERDFESAKDEMPKEDGYVHEIKGASINPLKDIILATYYDNGEDVCQTTYRIEEIEVQQ